MSNKLRTRIEGVIAKLPHPKVLLALTTAILIGVIMYIVILFLSVK